MRDFLALLSGIVLVVALVIACTIALGCAVDPQQLLDHPRRFLGLVALVSIGVICLGPLPFPMGNRRRTFEEGVAGKSFIEQAHELGHLRPHRKWDQSDLMVH